MFRFHLIAALLLGLFIAPNHSFAQCVSTDLMSPNGENPINITVNDGIPDVIMFEHTDAGESSYAYAITDADFNILKVMTDEENSADFEGSGAGACWVWGFSYTGEITAEMGDFVFRTKFSTGCWQISRTALSLIRTENDATTVGQLFASSNNQGLVGVYTFLADNSTRKRTFMSAGADADGIFYDKDADVVYQLDRANNALQAYMGVNDSGLNPMMSATSSMDFANGREIAVTNGKIVVAQDASDSNGGNQFFIYDYSPTGFTLEKVYDADINLWGIHAEGTTIHAIEDNTNRLSIYENFFDQAEGPITATRSIEIEGIVRTHGITYDAATDMMFLTDVGAASSATDGAFSVIMNFTAASMDGFVSLDEQIVVAGDATLLGNPLDIAFDDNRRMIFIAERANNGGRILGFFIPRESGNIAPVYDNAFPGASAVYFSNQMAAEAQTVARVYASSNNNGMVGVFDLQSDKTVSMSAFASMAMDADGIYYDADVDVLYQLSRSGNVINAYSNVSEEPVVMATSSSDFSNGREIAIRGNKMVVAQDASDSNDGNKFLVYNFSPIAITLDKVHEADINLWGIHAEGSTLFAIEDNSDRLSVYEDFFNQPAGPIIATQSIQIEGIVRTHGITYDAATDMMFLTDVGAASSATDGGFSVIMNYMEASADGFVSLDEQIVVAGDATFLGNPLDIAFDPTTQMIFIAERASGGGRILGFNMPMESGNMSPAYNMEFAGASAVYLHSMMAGLARPDEVQFQQIEAMESHLTVFPNPSVEQINLRWNTTEDPSVGIIRILNIQGQELMTRSVDMQAATQASFPIIQLASGVYQMTLEHDGKLEQHTFVKQ
ncbi:MAG: T9SS type A sorting domain-containing protein [Bacteroidota bacterium]